MLNLSALLLSEPKPQVVFNDDRFTEVLSSDLKVVDAHDWIVVGIHQSRLLRNDLNPRVLHVDKSLWECFFVKHILHQSDWQCVGVNCICNISFVLWVGLSWRWCLGYQCLLLLRFDYFLFLNNLICKYNDPIFKIWHHPVSGPPLLLAVRIFGVETKISAHMSKLFFLLGPSARLLDFIEHSDEEWVCSRVVHRCYLGVV